MDSHSPRRTNFILVLITIVGLVVNLFFASKFKSSIAIYNLNIDSSIYRSFALSVIESHSLNIPHAFAPGIVFYLASIFSVFGYSPIAVKVSNCFLISLIALEGAWLSRETLKKDRRNVGNLR